jgi:hypothetical protein
VGDNDVDGAAGVVELGDARVVVGAETLGAARDGALLVEERA